MTEHTITFYQSDSTYTKNETDGYYVNYKITDGKKRKLESKNNNSIDYSGDNDKLLISLSESIVKMVENSTGKTLIPFDPSIKVYLYSYTKLQCARPHRVYIDTTDGGSIIYFALGRYSHIKNCLLLYFGDDNFVLVHGIGFDSNEGSQRSVEITRIKDIEEKCNNEIVVAKDELARINENIAANVTNDVDVVSDDVNERKIRLGIIDNQNKRLKNLDRNPVFSFSRSVTFQVTEFTYNDPKLILNEKEEKWVLLTNSPHIDPTTRVRHVKRYKIEVSGINEKL